MDQDSAAAGEAGANARVSFEHLRERTDELELIISGLSLFALLSLPDWLWNAYESYFARMSIGLAAGSAVLLPILSAICYVMAALFLLHLAVRAYWVGLIGLKAAFPEGVRWERLHGIGPLTLGRMRARQSGLEQGIGRADVIASTLFSLITFTATALGVLGLWLALLFLLAALFGEYLGGTNSFVNLAGVWLSVAFFGLPLARWLLDGVLLRWLPGCRRFPPLRGLVRVLGIAEGLFLPQRLLGSVRLTLQSHLLPRTFLAVFMGAVMLVAFGSNLLFQRGRGFDVLGSQQFVTTRDVHGGMRSAHYESQRVAKDGLRAVPMIPAPLIETDWLPVFLPYVALIDDPVLMSRCPPREVLAAQPFGFDPDDSDAEAMRREAERDQLAGRAAACLRRLWEVRLDGEVRALDGFMPSERSDLGLRGLAGWLPLDGLTPGPHRLEVIWRPQPEQDTIGQDYVPQRVRHLIPFLWDPDPSPPTVPAAR